MRLTKDSCCIPRCHMKLFCSEIVRTWIVTKAVAMDNQWVRSWAPTSRSCDGSLVVSVQREQGVGKIEKIGRGKRLIY